MKKKITKATIKAFIKREIKNNNLYISQKSSFDGMIDCVAPTEDSFKKVDSIDFNNENDLGIKGLWLVNRGNDYFKPFANNDFRGYEVSNCCGVSIIAMKKLYYK